MKGISYVHFPKMSGTISTSVLRKQGAVEDRAKQMKNCVQTKLVHVLHEVYMEDRSQSLWHHQLFMHSYWVISTHSWVRNGQTQLLG